MLNKKYSGINDGKPYPVDMVAFKDGDSVSNLNVENGELKLNDKPVGGGSGGGIVIDTTYDEESGYYRCEYSLDELYNLLNSGAVVYVKHGINYRIITEFAKDSITASWVHIGNDEITKYNLTYSNGNESFRLYESGLTIQQSGGPM